MAVELHFQEGFCGEVGKLLLDGQAVAQFTLLSRPQTGLAHIESIDIKPDQKLQIMISSCDQIYAVPLKQEQGNVSGISYYVLNLCAGSLEIKQTAKSPGYM